MIDTIVKINSSTVTITGNPQLERNVKEELDTGSIVIESIRENRYEMYDKVDITTPYENEEQYLIQSDNPVQLNATEYQHNITLFENIAYFNTIYPADRSFKVIGQTLGDILNVYERELNTYHNIVITWTTIPQLVLDETIPFKEFAGLNLSSILLSLFRKIWAVPKVNRIGDEWDIYPLYHNEKNNSISSESISKMSQLNNVDYATKVKSQLKNAVNERTEGEVSWFPSENGYVIPRSSSIEKITSNLRYELDSDIIAILKVEAVGVDYHINYASGDPDDVFTNQTIDITSQIIHEEIWDSFPPVTSVDVLTIMETNNLKNNVRYKVGQPYITNLFESATDRKIFTYDTPYLLNTIKRALYVLTGLPGGTALNILDAPLNTEDVKLRVKYIRQRNIDLIHNRKTKGDMNDITSIHQQRDASVEVNEYKKNLKIYSNRMGNSEFSKTKMFIYPDVPYELFDYTDNKTIVTRVQNTFHNLFVYCEYEESVSFSNIEAEYALMRRSDPYTINTKSVTTNLIVQEYIEFSTIQKDLDTRITSNARRLLLGLFEATTIGYDKVAVGVFKPVLASWNSSYAIHMPVEASGDGALITVHVQFPHQTIAGKTYYDLVNDTYQAYLNPLAYTGEEGMLEDYQLYFTPDIAFEDAGQYPIILDETNYLASPYTLSGIPEPLDLDTTASFANTFQISFIADENIYIGNAMAKSNYFIKDQATTSTIKIWTSTKPYGQYDQTVRASDTDNTVNISYAYSYLNRTITITPSINVEHLCIVKDDEILLAINEPIIAGATKIIYVNYLNDTLDVKVFAATFSAISSLLETHILGKFNYYAIGTLSVVSSLVEAHALGSYNYYAIGTFSSTASLAGVHELGLYNYYASATFNSTASLAETHSLGSYNYYASGEFSTTASLDVLWEQNL